MILFFFFFPKVCCSLNSLIFDNCSFGISSSHFILFLQTFSFLLFSSFTTSFFTFLYSFENFLSLSSILSLYRHTAAMMSSIGEEVKYSRANSDQDSTEHLLSDEERHVRQPPECRTTFWRRVLKLMPYILGTLLACFFAGIAGFFLRHDLDGVCAAHTSQHCE